MVSAGLRADEQHRPGAGDVGQRERQAAVDAERPVRRPSPPTTCRTGRCSRSSTCRSATRANLPNVVGLLVGQPAAAEAADARRARSAAWAARIAGDDPVERLVPGRLAERAGPVAADRGPAACSQPVAGGRAARPRVQPFAHSPPRLVGKSRLRLERGRPSDSARGSASMPHCSEQYGQCVEVARDVGGALTPSCFGSPVTAWWSQRLRRVHLSLTRRTPGCEAPREPLRSSSHDLVLRRGVAEVTRLWRGGPEGVATSYPQEIDG